MLWIWSGFVAFILILLALDLGVFHRRAHVVAVKEALLWSGLWISLGLLFTLFVYHGYERHWLGLGDAPDPVDGVILSGSTAALKYVTGFIVEKSLSIDNIFVIAMIFRFFGVPALYQHRVLFWGILGALVMRGAMIAIGASLIARFHWVLYLFGAFLILTGLRMLWLKSGHTDLSRNPVVRFTRRFFRVTTGFHGGHFAVRAGSPAAREARTPGEAPEPDAVAERARPGSWLLTPLALALIMVETTDLIFAVDSIPAIFAITGDAFLVFTSNVFAILGLRALYFALADLLDRFRYLKTALALVLVLVGVKMLVAGWAKAWLGQAFNLYVLGMVLLILGAGIGASLLSRRPGSRG